MAHKRIEDGGRISAIKWGRNILGTVESSRVKYGGELQYYVRLDQPVARFVDGFREDREYALVPASDVLTVYESTVCNDGSKVWRCTNG